MELQHYVEIVDMVHVAIKVEKQIKRKGSDRGYSTSNSQGASKNASMSQTKKPMVPVKTTKPVAESSKGKAVENFQNRWRDIKCFKCLGRGHIASQCPNRSAMVLRPNSDIESEEEDEKNENEIDTPTDDEEELEYAVKGEMLVVKMSLSAQSTRSEPQRENLFHTRCHVQVSTLMVEKLALLTTKHPSPYKLQWLNESVELKVTKQALVAFSIGNLIGGSNLMDLQTNTPSSTMVETLLWRIYRQNMCWRTNKD
ncbi:Transposon Ty3-I Gag-Pol polyprotein [Gossypium australe]|uniref:Transposon Ty3-I Gag-Pol polyprotein n=1 Tax=Gossypium australe TaxID=47621 RepID=A0A5B6X463_9ROSI|nr:Transposon Ty3-I Gag-Pol polyprotein [Gossypium australe]